MSMYKSKLDRWLLVPVLVGSLMPTAALVYAVVIEPRLWREVWWAFGVLGATLGFVWWIFTSTHYALDDRELLVRSGPFRWRISLASLESVRPTRNPLSSPALSLDRLELRYDGGRRLLISPGNREEFLADLTARAPQLGRG